MKMSITSSMFIDQFHKQNRGNNFSHDALILLFDYFEETDEGMELDVIAICCEYTEEEFGDVMDNYDIDIDTEDMDEDDVKEAIEKWINEHTTVVGVTDDTIIFANF